MFDIFLLLNIYYKLSRVELELGEYTTGHTSAGGEDLVRHPPPESYIEEDEGSIELITHDDDDLFLRMSDSESDEVRVHQTIL